MNHNKRPHPHNLATVLNKPYPLPKQWIWAVLTRDNRRVSLRVEASDYERLVAGFRSHGVEVAVGTEGGEAT